MILVDTSVWIDHLHQADPRLVTVLEGDVAGSHPAVIEELALGSVKNREALLSALSNLSPFPVLSHRELLAFVERHTLWGRGLSAVDAHLLGSVLLFGGARLWTRDERLLAAAEVVGVNCIHEG